MTNSKDIFDIAIAKGYHKNPGYKAWCEKHKINPNTARRLD